MNLNYFKAYVFSLLLLICFNSLAQTFPKNYIKDSINSTFELYKNRTNVCLELEYEKDLQEEYYKVLKDVFKEKDSIISNINSSNLGFWVFRDERKGSSLANYKLLKGFSNFKNKEEKFEYYVQGLLGDYGILYFELTPDSINPDIFINGKYLGRFSQAKNGIKMRCNTIHIVELKLNGIILCSNNFLFREIGSSNMKCVKRDEVKD